jgi:hypothetical protein
MKRKFREDPFMWVSKPTARLISKSFPQRELKSAFSVCFWLAMLASDNNDDKFSTYKIELSEKSGVGMKTLTKILRKFRDINIIHATQEKLANGKFNKLNLELLNPTKQTYPTVSSPERSEEKPWGKFERRNYAPIESNKKRIEYENLGNTKEKQLLIDSLKNGNPSTPYARMAMRIMLEGKGLLNKLNPYEAKK